MQRSLLCYIRNLPKLFAQVQEMKQTMDETTQEIADTKALVISYRDNVNARISDLETQLASHSLSPEAKAALDDLKATAQALTLPA
jgi:DNA-binding protein YbaB